MREDEFVSYLKKAIQHAESTGITKNSKYVISAVFLDEEGNPDEIWIDSRGNNMEKFGMVNYLINFLDTKVDNFSDKTIGDVQGISENTSSSPLSDEERSQLSEYTKKLIEKDLTPEEKKMYTDKVKEIMKKAVASRFKQNDDSSHINRSSKKTSPEEEKKIKDFMEKFGKNLKPGDDFNERDLNNLL